MAVTAWSFYRHFIRQVLTGNIDMSGTGTTFRMVLCNSASNAESTALLSSYGSLTGELATDNGYTAEGKALAGVNLSIKTTTSIFSWLFNTVVFTAAAGSAMTGVKYVVIRTATSSILVAYSRLSTAEITVPAGNELHIGPEAASVHFEMQFG